MKTIHNIILYICAAILLYILFIEMRHETGQMPELKSGIQDTVIVPGTVDTVLRTNRKKVKGVLHTGGDGMYRDSISDNEIQGVVAVRQAGDSILYDLELDIKSYMFHKTDTLRITRTDTLIYHHTQEDESFFSSFEGGVITTAGILFAALLLILGLN